MVCIAQFLKKFNSVFNLFCHLWVNGDVNITLSIVYVAQIKLAGQEGISHEMITLEIKSNNVPDLTLIDLPGIVRVATGNQPKDIEKQVRFDISTVFISDL